MNLEELRHFAEERRRRRGSHVGAERVWDARGADHIERHDA